jgi:uracil-DNA glycosylase
MQRRNKLDRELEKHCEALAACHRCDHGEEIRPIVSLARRPQVILIGQAPGKVETTGGRAFAGRAGKTLFRWLERAGLDEQSARQRIYIAAITRCYPGPSPSGRGDRLPSPTARASCASWLDDELRLIRPRIVLPVGRLAIERFLPRLPLEQLIGREHAIAHSGGQSLAIPLPHPSGASSWIHQGDHMTLLFRALALIQAHLVELGIVDRAGVRSVA